MKVLFVTKNFSPTRNSSFMTITGNELFHRGHEVIGMGYDPIDNVCSFPVQSQSVSDSFGPTWIGKWLLYRRLRGVIADLISDLSPDVVVADRRSIAPTVQVTDAPTVAVVQGLGFTRFDPLTLSLDKRPRFRHGSLGLKLQYPFVRSLHRQNASGIVGASEVVAVSEFVRESLCATFNRDATVLRIPVRTDEFIIEDPNPHCITAVNLRGPLKGPNIFLDIATAMPDRPFLLVGPLPNDAVRNRAELLENVEYTGWVDDMSTVYERTKLLLVPSIYQEGSPRVIVEALCAGIPIVGSNRGGIPETVGVAGETVEDIRDIPMWCDRITKVLDEYDSYTATTSGEAVRFNVEDRIDDFERLLADAD